MAAAKNPAQQALQRRIHTASGAKDLDAGLSAYEEMKAGGFGLRIETFNTLMHLAVSLRNVVRALCVDP